MVIPARGIGAVLLPPSKSRITAKDEIVKSLSFSVCHHAQWTCKDEPCPGKCQVYGNGHYQTFDSKWYRFDGHCQYTLVEVRSSRNVFKNVFIISSNIFNLQLVSNRPWLVTFLPFLNIVLLFQDYCGDGNGSFSVKVGSVPCCDEALTCSRSIILDLKVSDSHYSLWNQKHLNESTLRVLTVISCPIKGEVTLTLSDMRVTRRLHKDWTLLDNSLYTTHSVGLFIIISVPSKGITLIWDKHTRITIKLHPNWRVTERNGLCQIWFLIAKMLLRERWFC